MTAKVVETVKVAMREALAEMMREDDKVWTAIDDLLHEETARIAFCDIRFDKDGMIASVAFAEDGPARTIRPEFDVDDGLPPNPTPEQMDEVAEQIAGISLAIEKLQRLRDGTQAVLDKHRS